MRGGVVNDSGWIDCATLANGAQLYSSLNANDSTNRTSAIFRRVIDLGAFKFVIISGKLGSVGSIPASMVSVPLVQLPDGLPVSYQFILGMLQPGTSSSIIRWNLSYDGTSVSISAFNKDSSITADQVLWLPINLMYISK